MPQSKFERIVAGLGTLAIVGLAAIIVPMWLHYRDSVAAAHRPVLPTHVGASTRTAPSVTPRPAGTTGTTTAAVPRRFDLAATGGSCWLEVHARSSQGKLLYQGLLGNGNTLTFSAARLWIRVGAGQKLHVAVDGRTLPGVPKGTSDILVTPAGVRPGTA